MGPKRDFDLWGNGEWEVLGGYLHNEHDRLVRALAWLSQDPKTSSRWISRERGDVYSVPQHDLRWDFRKYPKLKAVQPENQRTVSILSVLHPKNWATLLSFSHLTLKLKCCQTNFVCCFLQVFVIYITTFNMHWAFIMWQAVSWVQWSKGEKQNGCPWEACSLPEEVEELSYLFIFHKLLLSIY